MGKQKTILVTGGAGFVGTNLCVRLLADGQKVICLDDFSTGAEANLTAFLDNKNFSLIKGDVKNLSADNIQTVDQIFNLACPASPKAYQKDPVQTLMTGILGTKAVLDLAKKYGATVVQASTSEVYGNPLQHPQKETYWGNVNPIGVRSCYDEGKRAAETLCADYSRLYQVKVKIARIFNTYGPHMDADDGRVVSNFIVQALKNQPLTIYGDGSQTRSFQYIDDLVGGLMAVMDKGNIGPFNLGNPDEFTVNELADIVLKLLPESRSKKTNRDLPADDPIKRKPDIAKAKSLGWEPKIKLRDGLVKTIDYFKTIPAKILGV